MSETTNDRDIVPTGDIVPTVVWPNYTYRDPRAAIRWLVDVLGFEEVAVYGEGERVEHAELRRPGGGGIMLGTAKDDGPICGLPAGVGSAYVVIDTQGELREIHEKVVATGVEITQKYEFKDYGGAGFTCRDPEGIHWSLGTYRGE